MKKRTVLQKAVSLTASSVLAIGLLAGCGSNETVDEVADADNSTESASVTKVSCVTGGSPRPMIYYDENQYLTGYDTEVLREIDNLLPQYEFEFVVTDRDSMFAGLNAGTYDIGFNNFSYNDERKENYLFTYPYNSTDYVFVYRDDAEPINSYADAAGRTFEEAASVAATLSVEAWNEKYPDQAINISYSDADAQVKLSHLSDGSTDVMIYAKTMFDAYIEEYGITNLTTSPVPDEEVALIAGNLNCYFLLAKDDEELRDAVNEALLTLKENGTLSELSIQFFGEDYVPDDAEWENKIN